MYVYNLIIFNNTTFKELIDFYFTILFLKISPKIMMKGKYRKRLAQW